MNRRVKFWVFTLLLLSMVTYIGWVFYISEPKYVNNCYKNIEPYDYVSIRSGYTNKVDVGIVLQIDTNTAIIKTDEHYSDLYELNIKNHGYRIIGKGTIYHKINNYVGFNIMLITQIFIMILCVIIMKTLYSLLDDFLW